MSLITILECIVIQRLSDRHSQTKIIGTKLLLWLFSAFSNFCLLSCRTDQVDANKCYTCIMAQKCSCLDSDIL